MGNKRRKRPYCIVTSHAQGALRVTRTEGRNEKGWTSGNSLLHSDEDKP